MATTWGTATIIRTSLRRALLYRAHDRLLTGYWGGRWLYSTTRRLRCWPRIVKDVCAYLELCLYYRKHKHHPALQRLVNLFPLEDLLGPIAMDKVGLLPETITYNRFVVVISDRLCKLIGAIQTKETTATHIDKIGLNT